MSDQDHDLCEYPNPQNNDEEIYTKHSEIEKVEKDDNKNILDFIISEDDQLEIQKDNFISIKEEGINLLINNFKYQLYVENNEKLDIFPEIQQELGPSKFEMESNFQFSLYCDSVNKIEEQILNSNSIIENYFKENSELKKLNDILEREINLLKSLILINNLNLNTSDTKPLYRENYFVEMCNEENLKVIINDDKLYKQQEILHIMQLKINNLKERLDLFKKGFEEDRRSFLEYMELIHKRIMDYFNNEIKIRKTIEEKVSNIKKLI